MAISVPGLARADFGDLPLLEAFGVHGEAPMDGPLHLTLSRGLRSWQVIDSTGSVIALLHGLLLEGWLGEGLSVTDGSVRVDRPISTTEALEQHVVHGLNGSFVLETLGEALPRRLYPDCSGSLSIVFCADLRRIGSSADQILDDAEYQQRFLHARYQRLVAKEGSNGWIPGTLTAHQGVSRLLLNHYLDLDEFTQHRFWPHAALLAAPESPFEETAQLVARQLAGFAAAAAGQCRICIAQTAGLDSRLVLAAFRQIGDKITAMTFGGNTASFDQVTPPILCRMTGTPHHLVPVVRSSPAEIARWDRMVGHAVREVNRSIYPSLRAVDADVIVTGLYGEPGRCRLYYDSWQQLIEKPLDARIVIGRLKQPFDAEIEADIEWWLAQIAHMPNSVILDLAYLEHYMGSWAMGQNPVQNALHLPLMPLAQWSIQEAFLRASVADRASRRLLMRIGEILWPESMQVPINRFGDWRDRIGPLWKFAGGNGLAKLRRFLRMKRAG